MRKISIFACVMVMIVACVKQKESVSNEVATEEQGEFPVWKEMDDFHMAMAESYHPYRDSANLAPAKLNAVAMRTFADAWSKSAIPAHLDAEKIRVKLEELTAKSGAFERLVASNEDAAIGSSLDSLHTIFHDIKNLFYQGDSTKHEHHHHH